MRLSALFIASSLVACVGDAPPTEDDPEIIGGQIDYGDPAVVYVRSINGFNPLTNTPNSFEACTGTLITSNVVLLAAHCLAQNAIFADAAFAGGNPNVDAWAPIGVGNYVRGTIIVDELYDGVAKDGHDVAVLLLSRPVGLAPVHRGPTPVADSYVTAVGYGMTTYGTSGPASQKRHIAIPVLSVQPLQFTAGYEGQNVCHGDSGGPVLQLGRIVGINDWVDTANCHGSGHFTRLDGNIGFIHRFAPAF